MVESRGPQSREETKRVIDLLVNRKFDQLWEGRALLDFSRFFHAQAASAGAFVLTIPSGRETNEGHVWFLYRVRMEEGRLISSMPVVAIPQESEAFKECPQGWEKFPRWQYKP